MSKHKYAKGVLWNSNESEYTGGVLAVLYAHKTDMAVQQYYTVVATFEKTTFTFIS